MEEARCQSSPLEAMESKEVVPARLKRSKSDSDRKVRVDKLDRSLRSFHHLKLDVGVAKGQTDTKKAEVKSCLKQEIQQLEKRLQDQVAVRQALERAVGYRFPAIDSSNDSPIPKTTKELIRDIAMLELEVMYLEQYLLSLYRKAFDQQLSSFSSSPTMVEDQIKEPLSSEADHFPEDAMLGISSRKGTAAVRSSRIMLPRKSSTGSMNDACFIRCQGKHGPGVHRSHSSILQRSVCSARVPPSAKNLSRALGAYHTLPFSLLKHELDANSEVISLAAHLGTSIADHVPETPNRLSEDIVRCMGAILHRVGDSSLVHHGLSCSPASSFSSMSAFSSQYIGDTWSPGLKRESTLSSRLDNPFCIKGIKECNGPYNTMLEVSSLCKERQRQSDVEDMLHDYQSLVHRLQAVDPRKMKSDEKLAFWINIHNALVMHAHLGFGIPQNNMKRAALLIKATCNIGGQPVNADMIQGSILGCRAHPPGQWIRLLLSPKPKSKDADDWQAYAIERPEPLLHFALCSGSLSDPAVRVYTPKRLFQQLEAAKEEYIRATISIRKEQKILLPKIIGSFAKESKLSVQGLLDMIECCLPEALRTVTHRCMQGKSRKVIEWVPHNYTFRYLLSRELANAQMS